MAKKNICTKRKISFLRLSFIIISSIILFVYNINFAFIPNVGFVRTNSTNIVDDKGNIISVTKCIGLYKLHYLEQLDISCFSKYDSNIMFLKNYTNLKKLTITAYNEECVVESFPNIANLQDLSLIGFVGDKVKTNDLYKCKSLKKVCFNSCNIDNLCFLSYLEQLKSFEFWGSWFYTIDEPEWNTLSLGKDLEYIDLYYITYDYELLCTIKHMDNVKKVNIVFGKFSSSTESGIATEFNSLIEFKNDLSLKNIDIKIMCPDVFNNTNSLIEI